MKIKTSLSPPQRGLIIGNILGIITLHLLGFKVIFGVILGLGFLLGILASNIGQK